MEGGLIRKYLYVTILYAVFMVSNNTYITYQYPSIHHRRSTRSEYAGVTSKQAVEVLCALYFVVGEVLYSR